MEQNKKKQTAARNGRPFTQRALAGALTLILALTALAGCAKGETRGPSGADGNDSTEETVIRLAGMTGPTTMGMVKLIDDAKNGTGALNVDVTIAGSADEITPKLIKGELDIAAVPSNLASVLYNKTNGGIRALSVNVLNVLYIVELGGESVRHADDLVGRTIYCTGKGSSPEYTLRYMLEAHGINPDTDLTLEFKSEPTEIVALMAARKEGDEPVIAMLPEPYVSVAMSKVSGLRRALSVGDDMTMWSFLSDTEKMAKALIPVTAVTVVRTEFSEAHPELVDAFIAEYEASVEWVNANTADAAVLIESYFGVPEAIAAEALPHMQLVCEAKGKVHSKLDPYLNTLYRMNPASIGGELPGAKFYYTFN